MNHSIRISFLIACTVLAASGARAGESCNDQFGNQGGFLDGETYTSTAVIPGALLPDAFARAYKFTASHYDIAQVDPAHGVITALQTASYDLVKPARLEVSLRSESGTGVRVSISYHVPAGVFMSSDAIHKSMCATISSVGDTQAVAVPVAPVAVSVAVVAPTYVPRQLLGYANPSVDQIAAIAREVARNVPPGSLRKIETEAEPTIREFMERMACMSGPGGASAMNIYAGPGIDLGGVFAAARPMSRTPSHASSSCLTVKRVHGWMAPSEDVLRFETVYVADDTGEATKSHQELKRQQDGTWLVTQVSID